MKKINHFQLEKLLKNKKVEDKKTEATVREIIERVKKEKDKGLLYYTCLLYTSPSPRDRTRSRMPSSA